MTYYPRRWCRKFPNKMSRTEQTYHPLFVAVRQNAVHEIKSFWYRRKPEWWTANGAKRSSRNVWQSCSDYLSLFSLSSAGKKLNMFAVSVNDKSFLVRILKWRADPSSLLKKKKVAAHSPCLCLGVEFILLVELVLWLQANSEDVKSLFAPGEEQFRGDKSKS